MWLRSIGDLEDGKYRRVEEYTGSINLNESWDSWNGGSYDIDAINSRCSCHSKFWLLWDRLLWKLATVVSLLVASTKATRLSKFLRLLIGYART